MRTAHASLLVLGLVAAAQAQTYVAWPDGAQALPPNGSMATATANVTLNADHSLSCSVLASGLAGTVAHVHIGSQGVVGPILLSLAGGPTTWSGTTMPLTPLQQDALLTKGLYVDVHSTAFPGGEIRDQIVAVTVAHGLRHAPLGTAVLSLDPVGNLVVSNIGSSGQDGVAIDLGEAIGPMACDVGFPGLALDTNPGSHWSLSAIGQIAGVPGQLIGSMEVQRQLDKYSMAVDFSHLGTTTLRATASDGKVLLLDTTFPVGGDPTVFAETEAPGCATYSCPQDKCRLTEIEIEDPVLTIPMPSAKVKPSSLGVEAESPAVMPQHVARLEIVGAGVDTGSLTITKETLAVSGFPPHVALGQATLKGTPSGLQISNIGSSGQDGVSIDLGKSAGGIVYWSPLDPAAPDGAMLEFAATGSVSGMPGAALGSLQVVKAGSFFDIFADFSAIGSTTQHVQVYDDGVLVADFPGHSGPVGSMTSWASYGGGGGGGHLPTTNPDNLCFSICNSPDNLCFTIAGSMYLGDELLVIAEGGAFVDSTSALDVRVAGLPELQIVDEVVKPLATPWTNLGSYLGGEAGFPNLFGDGPLTAGSLNSLELVNAPPGKLTLLFVSFASVPTPFKGGVLLTVPFALNIALVTNSSGGVLLPFVWSAGMPSGLPLWFQHAIADPTAIKGVSLSNALRADLP